MSSTGNHQNRTERVQSKVTPDLFDELRRHCQKVDRSLSYVVERAIEEYMQRVRQAESGGSR